MGSEMTKKSKRKFRKLNQDEKKILWQQPDNIYSTERYERLDKLNAKNPEDLAALSYGEIMEDEAELDL